MDVDVLKRHIVERKWLGWDSLLLQSLSVVEIETETIREREGPKKSWRRTKYSKDK